MTRSTTSSANNGAGRTAASAAENREAPERACEVVLEALEDRKGRDIVSLDVRRLTDITDFTVIATGSSNRHVRALVDQVIEAARLGSLEVLGVEGRETGEWVLLDLGDVVVHVMQVAAREFYDLERLWRPMAADSAD